MKKLIAFSLLALAAATTSQAAESLVTGKFFGSSAEISISFEVAQQLSAAMKNARTQSEVIGRGQSTLTRFGDHLTCTETMFAGVGARKRYECLFNVSSTGRTTAASVESGVIGNDAPVVAIDRAVATEVLTTPFTNLQLKGNVARNLFIQLTQAKEDSLLGGKLIYRTGENVACTKTIHAGALTTFECKMTMNASGRLTADNIVPGPTR